MRIGKKVVFAFFHDLLKTKHTKKHVKFPSPVFKLVSFVLGTMISHNVMATCIQNFKGKQQSNSQKESSDWRKYPTIFMLGLQSHQIIPN